MPLFKSLVIECKDVRYDGGIDNRPETDAGSDRSFLPFEGNFTLVETAQV